MENKDPLITVIIAVYNGKATLPQCIESFIRQTYQKKQLIIIDGGSNDGTVAVLEENREHIDYWLSEPDRGIYNAWNKALPHVKGEWICFLGADDFFWDEKVLAKLAEHLEKLPLSTRLAYGRIMVVDPGGNELYPLGAPWHEIKDRFTHSTMCIPHPAVMHRKSLFEQHGRFDESFRIAADYEFLLRELPLAEIAFIPDVIVAGVRQGGISSTSANLSMALDEIRRAQRMHGYFPPWHIKFASMLSINVRLFLVKAFGDARVRKMINWSKRVSLR